MSVLSEKLKALRELTVVGENASHGSMADASRKDWGENLVTPSMGDLVSKVSSSMGDSLGARVSVRGEALPS